MTIIEFSLAMTHPHIFILSVEWLALVLFFSKKRLFLCSHILVYLMILYILVIYELALISPRLHEKVCRKCRVSLFFPSNRQDQLKRGKTIMISFFVHIFSSALMKYAYLHSRFFSASTLSTRIYTFFTVRLFLCQKMINPLNHDNTTLRWKLQVAQV